MHLRRETEIDMSVNTNHKNSPDAPQDWDRFARVLREHGEATPLPGLEDRLASGWEHKVARRRRARAFRRTAGSLAGVATLAGLFMFSWPGTPEESMPVPQAAEPQIEAEAPDIFANPDIPPIWVDTTFPEVEMPPFDLMEPGHADAGPGPFFYYADSLSSLYEDPVAGE